MTLEDAEQALCVERERRIAAEEAILGYWEPTLTELRSKYAAANNKIAQQTKAITHLVSMARPEPEPAPAPRTTRRWGRD
jgi:hypothetical protein